MNFLFSTLFMGLATYNVHLAQYGWALFCSLAALPYLIAMGLNFFLTAVLRDYIIQPLEGLADKLKKEIESKDA